MAIRIYVDQGHNPGPINAGAEANGLEEQAVNFQVGMILAGFLAGDDRFEVQVSRSTPEAVLGTNASSSLAARVNAANAWPANYFISIHCNANPNPRINGAEVYVYKLEGEAYQLAGNVLDRIVQIVGIRNNGVRQNSALYVLRRTSMPAILVELGYLTNPSDFEMLLNNQPAFGYAIYRGILDYFGLAPLD